MRIRCRHGFFSFDELAAGQLSRFIEIFSDLPTIVPDPLYGFTFETLANAPTHVIAGNTFLGAPATVTIEGTPWEIMRANGLIYNYQTDTVGPIAAVTKRLELVTAAHYFLSPGLIIPGTVTDDGERVTDYAAWYQFDSGKFKYSEVTSE